MLFFCLCFYRLHCLCFLQDGHDRTIFFDNAGFCLCNLGQCISKKLHMIHADRSNNGAHRLSDHIRCIRSAAHSNFQQYIITFFLIKIQKCHRCFHFKNRRMFHTFFHHAVTGTLHLFHDIRILLVAHGLKIDPPHFHRIKHRRGTISAYPVSGFYEYPL